MAKNIRRFQTKAASVLNEQISSTLWRCNAKDYLPEVLCNMEADLSAKNLVRSSTAREIFSSLSDSKIAGDTSLSGIVSTP